MVKQVIIIRKDLKMSFGKSMAQVAHASMKVFFDRMKEWRDDTGVYFQTINFTPEMIKWKNGLYTKIILGCNSEDELLNLELKARELNIPHAFIIDVGKTEFHNISTLTALAIGPDKSELIDKITGHLKLL